MSLLCASAPWRLGDPVAAATAAPNRLARLVEYLRVKPALDYGQILWKVPNSCLEAQRPANTVRRVNAAGLYVNARQINKV